MTDSLPDLPADLASAVAGARAAPAGATAAARALRLIDLTLLGDDVNAAAAAAAARKARSPAGDVAAVCVWPRHVATARRVLDRRPGAVGLATVVNFPGGDQPTADVASETREALADGADEIDVVLPWRQLLDGHAEAARDVLAACRDAAEDKVVKVILESAAFPTAAALGAACDLAIAEGADFLKTSTGKSNLGGASPVAAAVLLAAAGRAERPVGVKISGGVRTVADAALYLDIADRLRGSFHATPATFRIGASGLLDAVLAALGHTPGPTADGGY